MAARSSAAGDLPLVVHVGFAGSRSLVPPELRGEVDAAAVEDAVRAELESVLRGLPAELGLASRHVLCGVGQVAIGADTAFARACAALGVRQRVLLPQPRDEFLHAVGSNGTGDFSPEERAAATELLESPHVVEERVVSSSRDRHERFDDANLAIVRESDVVVAVVRTDAEGGSGGSLELIDRARARGVPVLELRAAVSPGGAVTFEPTWHDRGAFEVPALPAALVGPEFDDVGIDEGERFLAKLKSVASREAGRRQAFFQRAALWIVLTHVLATICAVVAAKLGHGGAALVVLLGLELALLATGFGVHLVLHRSHAARSWALGRLVAEVARSVRAVARVRGRLEVLHALPVPASLRALVRTLDVVHLVHLRSRPAEPWEAVRDDYVHRRLADPDPRSGQLAYYERELARARRRHAFAHRTFVASSVLAFVATLAKLLAVGHLLGLGAWPDGAVSVLGALAIVLPVLAVAALSLAASHDLEARVHTFEETVAALREHVALLGAARSEAEFVALVHETEAVLLGETVSWYSRRAFTGVA